MSAPAHRDQGTAVPGQRPKRIRYERFLGLFQNLRKGEERCVLLFFTHAFLLLFCYYILKTLREPLLLVDASPELKSYAYATVALVLLAVVPTYSKIFDRLSKRLISSCVTLFFVGNLGVFLVLGLAGADIGFAYYVWVGVFGVTILAQFWAHAADAFDVQSGQRLFPAIMAAAALGGLVGPTLVGQLFAVLGAWPLMLIAAALLTATVPLIALSRNAVPKEIRNAGDAATMETEVHSGPRRPNRISGFGLVLKDRYLLLLAALMVLLNCVNTTGEYLLTQLVADFASARVADEPTLDQGSIIAAFYGNYYLTINLLTVIAQLFIVSRLIAWIGVPGALLIVPVIALLGYGLVAFVPIFSVLRVIKIFENSTDYSIMNTSRQALYLPLPAAQKYQGKIAIDTFFYRFGDLLQAGIVFVGVNVLDFEFQHFAILNAVLAVVWFWIALQLAALYAKRTAGVTTGAATPRFRYRGLGTVLAYPKLKLSGTTGAPLVATALGVVALAVSTPIEAGSPRLFDDDAILDLEISMDQRALCRNPARRLCEDVSATLVYADSRGDEHRIEATVRARGRYREDTGDCRFPALFVFFGEDTQGTLFEGQSMLPLTTHCQPSQSKYERYVLREYLAYRIYDLLTSKSLRVRLARINYRDARERRAPLTRYGFFTEHFESLAARHDATVVHPAPWDPREADPTEIAVLDVFQYMIGNTDFSVVYGHNIVHLGNPQGLVTAVPYDFDFSGLVDAEYAGPPPSLPIRNVRQRLFRGVCRTDIPWQSVVDRFLSRERSILDLTHARQVSGGLVGPDEREYIESFFATLRSAELLAEQLTCRCRGTTVASASRLCDSQGVPHTRGD